MTQLCLNSKAVALVLDEKITSPCSFLWVTFSLLLQLRLLHGIFGLAVERGAGPGRSRALTAAVSRPLILS